MIISFSGVDGSGKSTLAKRLFVFLKESGKRVFLFEVYQYSIFLNLGKIVKSFSKKSTGTANKRAQRKESCLVSSARITALFFDICIFWVVKLWAKLFNKDIVCDRYLYDTLAHIVYTGKIPKTIFKFLVMIIPHVHVPLLLECEANISMQREAAHDNLTYFNEKLEIYRLIDTFVNFRIIKTENSVDLTWGFVLSNLGNLVKI